MGVVSIVVTVELSPCIVDDDDDDDDDDDEVGEDEKIIPPLRGGPSVLT